MTNNRTNREGLVEIRKGQTGTGLLIENDGYISLTDTENNKRLLESARQLTEGPDGRKVRYVPRPFVVDAVFQKYDVKNANGRIYPERILKRQVELYQRNILKHSALGELNHPAESVIDLGRVSHNIIELHWEGRTLVGKLELNLTDGFVNYGIVSSLGDTAANLLLNGYTIGVSSRGVGSVENKNGLTVVGDDFELICWDIVSTPSTPGAYISTDGPEELQQYIESDMSKAAKNPLHEKVDKIKALLS